MVIIGPIFILIGLGSLGDAAGTDERAEQIKIFVSIHNMHRGCLQP